MTSVRMFTLCYNNIVAVTFDPTNIIKLMPSLTVYTNWDPTIFYHLGMCSEFGYLNTFIENHQWKRLI